MEDLKSAGSGDPEPEESDSDDRDSAARSSGSSDAESSDELMSDEDAPDDAPEEAPSPKSGPLVWRNERPLRSDEELEVSPGCYDMLHRVSVDWSCLSFDVLKDDLGAFRPSFPFECFLVAGTQPDPEAGQDPLVHVMRLSNLTKNFGDDEVDEEDEDDCVFRVSSMRHPGVVNRIKACPQSARLVCSMSDSGASLVWDIDKSLKFLNSGTCGRTADKKPARAPYRAEPLHTCALHGSEGYAVSWSPAVTGRLATGANDGSLVLWEPVPGGWELRVAASLGEAVEDLRWSHKSENVLVAGCGAGMLRCARLTIRLFDTRDSRVSAEARVSDSDVNAVAVNPLDNDLVLAGCEDGSLRIFDPRRLSAHLSNLKWHRNAVTCVDWHPHDASVCAASSRDDSISLWDVSIEAEGPSAADLPQQLLFVHMGQTEITECMFHRNLPGVVVSTALDGFNVFKTVNVD